MKTKKERYCDILTITMKLEKSFSVLSKYLEELPAKYSNNFNSNINYIKLKSYYDSLDTILKKYNTHHEKTTI